MAAAMSRLAAEQPGWLGEESARDGLGINPPARGLVSQPFLTLTPPARKKTQPAHGAKCGDALFLPKSKVKAWSESGRPPKKSSK